MTTAVQNTTAVAAPVKAPEAATTAKAQWIKTLPMNFETTSKAFNSLRSDNCLLNVAAVTASVALAAITFVGELFQNVVYAVANAFIATANGVHSFFETTEEPKKAEVPAAPVAQAPVKAEDDAVPTAKPRKEVVKEAVISATNTATTYVKSHKAVVATGTASGVAAGVATSYFAGLGALASTASGFGAAALVGVGAHYLANRFANKAAPVVAAPVAAAPVAAPVVQARVAG